MKSMRTALKKPNIAAASATGSIGSGRQSTARRVVPPLQRAGGSALKSVGVVTGTGKKAKDTKLANHHTQSASENLLSLSGGNARNAELMICVCLKSITSTQQRRFVRLTDNIRHPFDLVYGLRKSVICKSSAPTAIASKRTSSPGRADIACRRIEDAYRQKPLFDPAPVDVYEQIDLAYATVEQGKP